MAQHDIVGKLATEMTLRRDQVQRTVDLLDEGNTVPFVARYRKEMTGSLDEEQLRNLLDRLSYLRKLAERQDTVIASITEQGKLTPELESAILAAETLQAVEDLYLPYKPKRRTRAMIAIERGLEPLADRILAQEPSRESPEQIAQPFVSEDVPTLDDALPGRARYCRGACRRRCPDARSGPPPDPAEGADRRPTGRRQQRCKAGLRNVLRISIRRCAPSARIRCWRSTGANARTCCKVRIEAPEDDDSGPDCAPVPVQSAARRWPTQLELAVADAYKRLIAPAIEREVRRDLTEQADQHAIAVFATNLRGLLLQPPLQERVVLGIDPGFRTGCKVAVVDATGKVLDTATIYPHAPQNEREQVAAACWRLWCSKHHADLIAIGNGTASRETEELVATLIRDCARLPSI